MRTPLELRDQQAPAGGWGLAVTIAVGVLVLNLVLAPWTTLWDRDEPRFARAAVEMERSGNFLYPTFNGELRPDKPILIYWLMAVSVRVLGPTELAVRCWSAVGAALTCLFTFLVGRRLFSVRAGHLAMLILASSPLFVVEAMAATTDAVLLAAITGAMAAFVAIFDAGGGNRLAATMVMAAAFAVAQLTKGPVGLAIPVVTMAGALWMARREIENPLRIGLGVGAAAALGVVVFAAWAVPANAATAGRLAEAGFGHHVLDRIVEPLEGHGGHPLLSLGFYLPVVLVGFLPWVVHLPGAMRALVNGEIGGYRGRSLLLSWIVLPIIVFSLVATKLPHYVLPVWPALALAVAGVLEEARREGLGQRTMSWLRCGAFLYGSVACLAMIGGVAFAWTAPIAGLRGPVTALIAALAAVTFFGVRCQLRGRPGASTAVLVAAMLTTQAVVGLWFGPMVERLKPVPGLAAAIRRATNEDVPVACFAFSEPSLVFYLNRSPVEMLPSAEAVVAWLGKTGPRVLVIPQLALDDFVERHGELPLHEFATSSGLNISTGEWVHLVALERRSP